MSWPSNLKSAVAEPNPRVRSRFRSVSCRFRPAHAAFRLALADTTEPSRSTFHSRQRNYNSGAGANRCARHRHGAVRLHCSAQKSRVRGRDNNEPRSQGPSELKEEKEQRASKFSRPRFAGETAARGDSV